ncbi:MAG: hypothetical protein HFJ46_06115 [Clostridia bacterium]|nr:hypothetical protein [Clostridia bacterium]
MKEKITKILKTSIISLILSIILNFIFLKTGIYDKENIIDRCLIIFLIIDFIGMHFSFGIKKLYNYIIDNRYIISGILLIFLTLFSYTSTCLEIEEMMPNLEKVIKFNNMTFAFWWNFRIILLVLVTFELCMIITNKNRFYAISGTIIICLSSVLKWNINTSLTEVLIYGQAILVLVNLFMNIKDKKLLKLVTMIAISISSLLYLCSFNLGYEISFAYLFIALLIWIVIKNRKEYKFTRFDLILLIIPVVTLLGGYFLKIFRNIGFIENTVNGNGFSLLMSYTYNVVLPFKDIENARYFSNILSIFPAPIIIAFYYLYKKEEHTEFLFPIAVSATVLIVHIMSGMPKIISDIMLFNFVSTQNAVITVGFLCVYLFLYILSNINEKIFNIKTAIRMTLITMCIIVFVKMPTELSAKGYLYLTASMYCLFAFLLFNCNDKKYKKVFFAFGIIITIISGFFVNPIMKGKSVIIRGKQIETLGQEEKVKENNSSVNL